MQFQQDYPQPARPFYPQQDQQRDPQQYPQQYPHQYPHQYPQQYPMVGRMQASVQGVSAIMGNIAKKEKYGQRMVCMSCAASVIGFLLISSFCAVWQIQHGHVSPLLLVVFGVLCCCPALCALAVNKESSSQGNKSLLNCFCCCSSLTVLVHLFMVFLYANFLIGIWGFRHMEPLNPECNVERCRPSEKVKEQLLAFENGLDLTHETLDGPPEMVSQYFEKLKPLGPIYSNIMMDCLAPVLWPKYVQASESEWSAELKRQQWHTGAKFVDLDALASNIFSEQKQYPDVKKCPFGPLATVCDLDRLPPLEQDEAPTSRMVFDACVVNLPYIDAYPYFVSGWWVPGLASAGLFLHSVMFLLMCCGCRAGRKFNIHEEVEIELALLRR